VASRRGHRRFKDSRGREHVWISDLTTTTTTGTGTSFVLMTPSDWERSAVSGETATIIRVVGWASVVREMTAVVVSTSSVAMMFCVQDEDAAPLANVSASANIVSFEDEKSMWSWRGVLRTDTATIGNFHPVTAFHFPFNIRVKRKITSGMTMDLALGNTAILGAAPTVRFDIFSRILVALQ